MPAISLRRKAFHERTPATGEVPLDGVTMKIEMAGLIDGFPLLNVAVVGDALLDGYLEGAVSGVCREAPAPVVTVHQRTYAPGGAGNTASNVAGLGGQAMLLSVIGTDREGDLLCEALAARGVKHEVRHPVSGETDRCEIWPPRRFPNADAARLGHRGCA